MKGSPEKPRTIWSGKKTVEGLGSRVYQLGFGIWGLGFGV